MAIVSSERALMAYLPAYGRPVPLRTFTWTEEYPLVTFFTERKTLDMLADVGSRFRGDAQRRVRVCRVSGVRWKMVCGRRVSFVNSACRNWW